MNCKHDFFYNDYREIPICKHCNKSAYLIIQAEQQAHNELKAKLQAVNNTCSELGSLRDIVNKISAMSKEDGK